MDRRKESGRTGIVTRRQTNHSCMHSFLVIQDPLSSHGSKPSLNLSILSTIHPATAPCNLLPSIFSILSSALPKLGLFPIGHPNLTFLPALQLPGLHAHCTQGSMFSQKCLQAHWVSTEMS